MANKVAKLVAASFMVRVIVDESDSDDKVIKTAAKKMMDKVENDLGDNIEFIDDDDECPYDPNTD